MKLKYERVDGLWVRPLEQATDHSVLAELRNDVYRLGVLSLDGAVVVDLGANVGAVSVACARLGATHVIAAEPESDNFALLSRNAADWPAIKPYNCAVGGTTGHVAVRGRGGGAHTAPGQDVPQVTLTRLLALADVVGDVALLKVDIEGGEYDALLSCPPALLRRFEHIAMELHGPEICPWVKRGAWERLMTHLRDTHVLDVVMLLKDLALVYGKRR